MRGAADEEVERSFDRGRRRRPAPPRGVDLAWHVGTFGIVNIFFRVLATVVTPNPTWAFWVALFWGLGLAFHALAYLVTGLDADRESDGLKGARARPVRKGQRS